MAILESELDPQSPAFARNAEVMQQAIDEFRGIEKKVIDTAEGKADRYIAKGYMPPRERLGQLLDPGKPFLELSTLCGYLQDGDTDGSSAGGSVIAGIGYISGIRCVAMVDDYLTKGGSISTTGMQKRTRMQNICLREKLPLVTLAQSGGGNLLTVGDVFGPSGAGFANQAILSAAGVPQITVVHGSATAGGAYQPGLSDYVVMVRNQSTVYLAGPPLLKAATGEIATDEEIGGAEMHTEISGVADYLAENDADGIRLAREITRKLGWDDVMVAEQATSYQPPAYDSQELLGLVPEDPKTPYDVREILARIADGSDFLEFKPNFDNGTICGHIEVQGYSLGIIGNNAPITANGAAKGAQFIQLCEQSNTPLLFLHNTTGFIVGTVAERAGIIKHGAKLIQAVTNSQIPKISIVVGGSYGAGNYAMCGRGMAPRFMFAWPRSVVSVMGPAQAGSVMRTVAEAKMARSGAVDTDTLDAIENSVVDTMEAKSRALVNTARVWDDGMIDPRDTREVVAFVLEICREADRREVRPNSWGVARF